MNYICKPSEICLEWKALKIIKMKLKPAVWTGVVAFIISEKLEQSVNKQLDLRFNFNFSVTFVRALSEIASLHEGRAQHWINKEDGDAGNKCTGIWKGDSGMELMLKIKMWRTDAGHVLLQ